MKKYLALALVMSALMFTQRSQADVSLGYETLTIMPNALVLYMNDQGSGWGLKASADFGTSFLSGLSSVLTKAFTFGLTDPKFSFATLSVTKDINRSGNIRDYLRIGGFFLTATSGNTSITNVIPTVGIGRDVSKFMNDRLIGNIELSYPEILTLNLRYSF